MKKLFLIVLSAFLLVGCSTSHLENGKESVVKFDEGGISAEDLYNKLKSQYGVSTLLDLIDEELLSREYKSTDDENTYVRNVVSSYKKQWGDQFLTNIQNYYGVKDEDAFKDMLRLSYKRNEWLKDYAKDSVTDKEIEEYYDSEVVGDMELKHILIKVDTSSTSSDSEKTEAEKKALETAKEVIKKLNDGESFDELAKEYSDDSANKDNGGSLGTVKFNDNYDASFMEAAKELKTNTYSDEPVKSQYGYHIIFKVSQQEKKDLDSVKDDIISVISEEKINNETNFSTKALLNLREKYGIKITDSELKDSYNERFGLN